MVVTIINNYNTINLKLASLLFNQLQIHLSCDKEQLTHRFHEYFGAVNSCTIKIWRGFKQISRKKKNAVYTGDFSFLHGKEKCVTLKAEHGVCTADGRCGSK